MKVIEAVKHIMISANIGVNQLADRIGLKQSTMSMRLRPDKDIYLSHLNEMLKGMDYKIIIVPRDTKLPKDSYEVE